MATRGAPLTTEATPVAEAMLMDQSEQLQAAQTEILKRSYRYLARVTHPDRGGSVDAFHAVNTAYRLRDLKAMHALSVLYIKQRDLQWVCGEGMAWVEKESRRPAVNEVHLRGAPEYAIAQAHAAGNKDLATDLAEAYIQTLYLRLAAELDYIINKGRTRNGEGQEEGQGEQG